MHDDLSGVPKAFGDPWPTFIYPACNCSPNRNGLVSYKSSRLKGLKCAVDFWFGRSQSETLVGLQF